MPYGISDEGLRHISDTEIYFSPHICLHTDVRYLLGPANDLYHRISLKTMV